MSKLNINLTDRDSDALDRLAQRREASKAAVVQDALRWYEWATSEQALGGDLILRHADHEFKVVIL